MKPVTTVTTTQTSFLNRQYGQGGSNPFLKNQGQANQGQANPMQGAQGQFKINPQFSHQQQGAQPKSLLGTQANKNGYEELKSAGYTPPDLKISQDGKPDFSQPSDYILQFSSIVLDRSGKYFTAGSYGGIIVSSKPGISDNSVKTDAFSANNNQQNKNTFGNTSMYKSKDTSTFETYFINPPTKSRDHISTNNSINCLAMIPAPMRIKEITAYGLFAGLSNGTIVTMSGFRTTELGKNIKGLNILKRDYKKEKESITAIAVSPNGQLLAYAMGDDFSSGCPKYSDKDPNNDKIKSFVKLIDTNEDFKKFG